METHKNNWDGDNEIPFIPSFLEQIINNEWIKSITLSGYMENYPARGLVYISTMSYDKMEEWVLLTDIRKSFKKIRKKLKDNEKKQMTFQFLKGGFCRYFPVKYPEFHFKTIQNSFFLTPLENAELDYQIDIVILNYLILLMIQVLFESDFYQG